MPLPLVLRRSVPSLPRAQGAQPLPLTRHPVSAGLLDPSGVSAHLLLATGHLPCLRKLRGARAGDTWLPRKAQGAGEQHTPDPQGGLWRASGMRLRSPSGPLAPIWKPKSQSLGLWMQDSLELLAMGWVSEFRINKSI